MVVVVLVVLMVVAVADVSGGGGGALGAGSWHADRQGVDVEVVGAGTLSIRHAPSPCWQFDRSAFVGHTPVGACLLMIKKRAPSSPPRSHFSVHGLAMFSQSVVGAAGATPQLPSDLTANPALHWTHWWR